MLISGNVRHAISHLSRNSAKSVSLKSGRGANMSTTLRTVLFVLCCFFVSLKCNEIHTSGLLDFEDSSAANSLLKTEKRIPTTISRTIDTTSLPSDVTSKVSCGPTGCNATNSNNNTVETEVIVHVQTKVNFDQTQEKKVVENEPEDVPVVLGYRGTRPDKTVDEERFRNDKPDIADRRDGFNGKDYGSFGPLYSGFAMSSGPAYSHRNRPSTSIPYIGSTTYRPPTNGYYESSLTPIPTTYGYFNPSSSRYPDRYPLTRPLDILALPVQIPDPNRRNYDYNYKENGVELQIPHFDHTFNKHYFSEEAPPHTILLGKSNTHNPVEFKGIPKNKWRPSFWSGRNHKYAFSDDGNNFMNYHRNPQVPTFNQPTHHRNHGTECLCRDHRSDTSDSSNSYAASFASHHIALPNKDPGASIDDKLASLN